MEQEVLDANEQVKKKKKKKKKVKAKNRPVSHYPCPNEYKTGIRLFKQREYRQAIYHFGAALLKAKKDIHTWSDIRLCLIARAQCIVAMGDITQYGYAFDDIMNAFPIFHEILEEMESPTSADVPWTERPGFITQIWQRASQELPPIDNPGHEHWQLLYDCCAQMNLHRKIFPIYLLMDLIYLADQQLLQPNDALDGPPFSSPWRSYLFLMQEAMNKQNESKKEESSSIVVRNSRLSEGDSRRLALDAKMKRQVSLSPIPISYSQETKMLGLNEALFQKWPFPLLELKQVAGKGLGIFAKKDIAKGMLIMQETPWLSVFVNKSSVELNDRCHNCHRLVSTILFPCSGNNCKAHYCSRICQFNRQQNGHRFLCGLGVERRRALESLILEIGTSGSSRFILMTIEFICQLLHSGESWKALQDPVLHRHFQSWNQTLKNTSLSLSQFLETQGYLREIFGAHWDPIRFNLEFLVVFIRQYLPIFVYGALPLISSDSHLSSGSIATRWTSFFNHDCRPNCVAVVNCDDIKYGNDLRVYSDRKISAGQELTVSYIPWNPSREIRHEMLGIWGFVCSCRACQLV